MGATEVRISNENYPEEEEIVIKLPDGQYLTVLKDDLPFTLSEIGEDGLLDYVRVNQGDSEVSAEVRGDLKLVSPHGEVAKIRYLGQTGSGS